MSTTINTRAVDRRFARVVGALACVVALLVAIPAVLAAVALQRFDHASPLDGVNAPWRWSANDLKSSLHYLGAGLDSSATLVDIFIRAALIVGWLCFAVMIFTVVDEMVFQLRHGMPSARRRRLVGLGPFGRRLATLLITVLPLAATAQPTLALGPVHTPATGYEYRRVSDLEAPTDASIAVRIDDGATAEAVTTGWSLVEVKR